MNHLSASLKFITKTAMMGAMRSDPRGGSALSRIHS